MFRTLNLNKHMALYNPNVHMLHPGNAGNMTDRQWQAALSLFYFLAPNEIAKILGI